MKYITMCSALESAAEATKGLTFSAREAALYQVRICSQVRLVILFIFLPDVALNDPERKNRHSQKGSRVGEILLTIVIST